ncbi:hypothetical protein BaRGS_00016625, partial [Batillaria attramentaria]
MTVNGVVTATTPHVLQHAAMAPGFEPARAPIQPLLSVVLTAPDPQSRTPPVTTTPLVLMLALIIHAIMAAHASLLASPHGSASATRGTPSLTVM